MARGEKTLLSSRSARSSEPPSLRDAFGIEWLTASRLRLSRSACQRSPFHPPFPCAVGLTAGVWQRFEAVAPLSLLRVVLAACTHIIICICCCCMCCDIEMRQRPDSSKPTRAATWGREPRSAARVVRTISSNAGCAQLRRRWMRARQGGCSGACCCVIA